MYANNAVRYFPKGFFKWYVHQWQLPNCAISQVEIGNFPTVQFPKWKLPNCAISQVETFQLCNFPSGNFPTVQFPKWQPPNCAISQVATFQLCNLPSGNFPSLSQPQRSTRQPILATLLSSLPLCSQGATMNLWEVAAWEIAQLEIVGKLSIGKQPLGSRPWEVALGKISNTANV